MMMGQLLGDVFREACWVVDGKASITNGQVLKEGKKVDEKSGEPEWSTGELPENKKEPLSKVLSERLAWHLAELDRRDKEVKLEIETEEKEEKKKITSEDMREGWSTSSISKPKESVIDDKPKPAPSQPKKQPQTETIEVLNPGAGASLSLAVVLSMQADTDHYSLLPALYRLPRTSTSMMTRMCPTSGLSHPQLKHSSKSPLVTLRNRMPSSKRTRPSYRSNHTIHYSPKPLTQNAEATNPSPNDASTKACSSIIAVN
jgi:hypothetical protein